MAEQNTAGWPQPEETGQRGQPSGAPPRGTTEPGPQKRPWYRKKRFLIPLILLALLVIVARIGGGGSESTSSQQAAAPSDVPEEAARTPEVPSDTAVVEQPAPEPEPQPTPEATAVGVGQPAADGRFTFTVQGLRCGETTVGDNPYIQEEAQGQFCLLDVRVENTGDSAQFLFADNQYLYAEDGTQYSASTEATFANDSGGFAFGSEINPGNAVEGAIVFDIPPAVTPVRAELHDSALSGGIEVGLQ